MTIFDASHRVEAVFIDLQYMCLSLTLCWIEATLGPPSVLGVVVHKHVVRDGEQVPLHRGVQRHHHLEAPHVPRVAGVFQTVLVALQEELEEESGRNRSGNIRFTVSIRIPHKNRMGSH